MKTFKQLIGSIEDITNVVTIEDATEHVRALESLVVTTNAPAITKLTALNRIIQVNATTAGAANDLITLLDVLEDVSDNQGIISMQDFETVRTNLCSLHGVTPEDGQASCLLGHVLGKPIYAHILSIKGRYVNVFNYRITTNKDRNTVDEPIFSISNVPSSRDTSPDYAVQVKYNTDEASTKSGQSITVGGESYSVTFDTFASCVEEALVTNTALTDIVMAAQVDGNISVDHVFRIINNFAETDVLTSLKSSLASADKLSYVAVCSAIAQVYAKSTGEQTAEDADEGFGYTLLPIPDFCTNGMELCLSSIISIASSVIGTILYAVNAALGALVTAIGPLIANIFKEQPVVTGSIDRASFMPVWNVPVNNDGYMYVPRALQGIVETQVGYTGCAAYGDPGGSPYWAWLIPASAPDLDGYGKPYACQYFINANGPSEALTTAHLRPATVTDHSNPNGWTVSAVPAWSPTSYSFPSYPDDPYTYVSVSKDKLLADLRTNILLMLGQIGSITEPLTITGMSANAPFSNVLARVDEEPIGASQFKPENDAIRVAYIYGVMRTHPGVCTSYEDIYSLLTWKTLYSALSLEFIGFITNPAFVSAGCELARPAVIYPSVSQNALITAITVGALVTVAAVATVALTKRARRNRASAKCTLRKGAYEKASKEYLANPTKENARLLNRAQVKYTRATNRAVRLGVDPFKGVYTSTPLTPAVDAVSLGDIQALSSSNVDNTVSLATLQNLIIGSSLTERSNDDTNE